MRFTIHTTRREELVDITAQVAEQVRTLGMADGAVLVFCPHTTAGVTLNENWDPDVRADLIAALERLVPRDGGWRHAEGNSDGHVKASLVGSSATVPVQDGQLVLGTWQGVYLAEFDGPRTRTVDVTALDGRRWG